MTFKRRVAFLIMPFAQTFDWLHEEIVAAGEQAAVEIIRADDIFESGVVIDQVTKKIREADVVIAVCTGRNPNVFYELGIAEASKRPILISENSDDLPFDLQHFRTQFYGGEAGKDSRHTLRARLTQAIHETIAASVSGKPEVLAQVMMQVVVAGLSRKGSLEYVPVDLVEVLEILKRSGGQLEVTGLADTYHILGRHNYEVVEQGQGLELLSKDYDFADSQWRYRLTEKGRVFLEAREAWESKMRQSGP